MSKTVTEINAERIEAIILAHIHQQPRMRNPRALARQIVEAFPELQQQAQYTSERDGTSRRLPPTPRPWP